MQGEAIDPRAPLGGNVRPIQPLNGRSIRTNIFVSSREEAVSSNFIINNNKTYNQKNNICILFRNFMEFRRKLFNFW